MIRINDTSAKDQGDLYLDTISGFVLIISDLDSKFRSVKDYLDCSDKEIEQQLVMYYGDSALQLISCNRSAYYPSQTTVLHFRVSSLPLNYDTYMMYFIHHRNEDIQIAFIYKKENETLETYNYIDTIMKTLKLK